MIAPYSTCGEPLAVLLQVTIIQEGTEGRPSQGVQHGCGRTVGAARTTSAMTGWGTTASQYEGNSMDPITIRCPPQGSLPCKPSSKRAQTEVVA